MLIFILIWIGFSNYRGVSNKKFCSLFKDSVRLYGFDLIILSEIRVNGEAVDKVMEKLGLSQLSRVEAKGRSNGIWVMLMEGSFQVETTCIEEYFVHLKISFNNSNHWWCTALCINPKSSMKQ